MLSLHRTVLSALNASFVTAGLLYLMFLLIHSDEPQLQKKVKLPNLTWSEIPQDSEPDFIHSKPTPPIKVLIAPPIEHEQTPFEFEGGDTTHWVKPTIASPGNKIILPPNNQLILAIGYPPKYPNSALSRGTEGYAIVGFSVTASGEVFDPFIIESEPARVFERSAISAISKFKYKPKMVDGKPVSVSGQRYMFTYELEGT